MHAQEFGIDSVFLAPSLTGIQHCMQPRSNMAPKRKQAPEENEAPPLLKTKRFVVNLTRIKGSMGLGIDDQRATLSKACRRHIPGRSRGLCPEQIVPLAAPAQRPAPASPGQPADRSAPAGFTSLVPGRRYYVTAVKEGGAVGAAHNPNPKPNP